LVCVCVRLFLKEMGIIPLELVLIIIVEKNYLSTLVQLYSIIELVCMGIEFSWNPCLCLSGKHKAVTLTADTRKL